MIGKNPETSREEIGPRNAASQPQNIGAFCLL